MTNGKSDDSLGGALLAAGRGIAPSDAPMPSLRPLILWLLGLTLLRLWLQSQQPLVALGSGADDMLFLDMAQNFLAGRWLGGYDSLRLVKGPGYPFWLAAIHVLHIPALLALHLFCAAVYWILIAALRPLIRSTAAPELVLFVVLLMSPVSNGQGTWTLVRDGIYPEQCVLVVACLIGLAGRCGRRPVVCIAWAAAAGLAMGWLYISREEGIWVLPTFALLLAGISIHLFRRRDTVGRVRWTWLPLIPPATMGAVIFAVSVTNYEVYGMFGVSEFKEQSFLAAMGAMQRPLPEHYTPQVSVPQDSMEKLFAVSPTLSAIRAHFEQDRPYFVEYSHRLAPELGDSQEVVGGMWIWEFRRAASAEGFHRDFPAAQKFYQAVADEINGAIDAGKYPGPAGPRRADGLSPPWRAEFAGEMAQLVPNFLFEILTFRGEVPILETLRSGGDDAILERYRAFAYETPVPNSADGAARYVATYDANFTSQILKGLYTVYRVLGIPLACLGIVCVVWLAKTAWRSNGFILLAWAAVVAGAATRAGLLLLRGCVFRFTRFLRRGTYRSAWRPIFCWRVCCQWRPCGRIGKSGAVSGEQRRDENPTFSRALHCFSRYNAASFALQQGIRE